MRLLIVTAVDAERDALQGTGVEVIAGGIGCAASAAATAVALARGGYDLVLSAGIAGGFAPLSVGDVAVATTITHADLGGEGFRAIAGARRGYEVEPRVALELADRSGGHLGAVLTVSTVTGSAQRAEALVEQYPDAIAEAMEGAGVAAAAVALGVPFAEVRAISNAVGPYDPSAWRVGDAFAALRRAVDAIGA